MKPFVLTIEYCTSWGFLSKAVSLTEEILSEYKNVAKELTVIPSTGGVYKITLNGETIFSKKELNRFPESGEILGILQQKLQ